MCECATVRPRGCVDVVSLCGWVVSDLPCGGVGGLLRGRVAVWLGCRCAAGLLICRVAEWVGCCVAVWLRGCGVAVRLSAQLRSLIGHTSDARRGRGLRRSCMLQRDFCPHMDVVFIPGVATVAYRAVGLCLNLH